MQSADSTRVEVLKKAKDRIGYGNCAARPMSPKSLSSASACGAMPASPPNVQRACRKGINIEAITTSEIKISVLIDAAYAELAVRTLHSVYGLDSRQGLLSGAGPKLARC